MGAGQVAVGVVCAADAMQAPSRRVRRGAHMISASLRALARLRAKSRRRRPPARSGVLSPPVEPVGAQAARIMADALRIEQVTAEQAARACERDPDWVQGVIDGAVDPTLDELELALNAIGLETRVSLGLPDEPWPPAVSHDRERIADTIRRHRALDTEMYAQVWIRRTPPQPGATARLFGAGPGRQDAADGPRSCCATHCTAWASATPSSLTEPASRTVRLNRLHPATPSRKQAHSSGCSPRTACRWRSA